METRLLEVRRVGRMPFGEAHTLQKELLEKRIAGEVGDVLLLTEHDPVVTVGRGASVEPLSKLDLPVVEVERGGEATYHGPGQLVAYPILALPDHRRDLHRYLRDIEEVVIRVLAEVDVEGQRKDGATGVWIGDKKVCSIGVAVRRWVTWHGLALNLDMDLDGFAGFSPCGFDSEVMTHLADYTELPPTRLLYEVLVVKHLCEIFALELPPPPPLMSPPEDGDSTGYSLPIFPG